MDEIEVLQLRPLPPQAQARLERESRVGRAWLADPETLAAWERRATVLVTDAPTGIDADLMARLPRLRLIAVHGVGLDKVDLAAAERAGVVVANTPGVLTDDVADFAVLLLLASFRRLLENDRHVRSGAWADGPAPLSRSLSRARVGIVGLGRIGQAVADRLKAFGCEIGYWARAPRPEADLTFEADLVALARDSDALIVCVAGGQKTRGLISAEVLDALGPEGVLVNIARGEVVDEVALTDRLASGALGAAGLDVFVDEPNVPVALIDSPRTVLQPHHASATEETREAMGAMVVDAVLAQLGRAGQQTV